MIFLSDSLTSDQNCFLDPIKDSAEQVIGRRKGSRKERWISERSWKLIDERKAIKIARDQTNSDETRKINNAEYEKKDKEVKKATRVTKENGWKTKAEKQKKLQPAVTHRLCTGCLFIHI